MRRITIGPLVSVCCVVLLGVASGIGQLYYRGQLPEDSVVASMLGLGDTGANGFELQTMQSSQRSLLSLPQSAASSLRSAAAMHRVSSLQQGGVHQHAILAATDNSTADGTAAAAAPGSQQCAHTFQCIDKYVCRDGQCTFCITDLECKLDNSKNVCFHYAPGRGHCGHKKLLAHFDSSDLWIMIITFITIMLSAPAGTGGGGVLVPMYILIGQFSPHGAIPLSKATIFGGAIANNFFNLQRRHPRADRPLVDYRTVVMLEPILLLGTVLGVFTNAISPGWLITIMLVVTLLFVTYRTTLKGIDAYRAETTAAVQPDLTVVDTDATSEEKRGLIGSRREASEAGQSAELEEMNEKEAKPFWWREIGVLCVAWLVIAITASLKGGDGAQGIAECGSGFYWFLVLLPVPLIGLLSLYIARGLISDNERKEALGFRFVEGDLRWSSANVVRYPAFCFFAGFAAGALGIAAGTVLGPVLLEMGMIPIVATASSGFMVLFTASSTTTQFLILGQLQLDYALFFAAVGVVGGGLGNTGVNYLVKKWRKTYFIIFILAGIIGVSVILMGVTGAVNEVADVKHGKSVGFRPLCSKD